MSNDETLLTRRELALTLENMSLTVAKEVGVTIDNKMQLWQTEWDKVSYERYREHVLELTGEPLENAEMIRAGIRYSIKAVEDSTDTKRRVKYAVIGYSIPLALGGFGMWIMGYLK
jgi:hypothetical protein